MQSNFTAGLLWFQCWSCWRFEWHCRRLEYSSDQTVLGCAWEMGRGDSQSSSNWWLWRRLAVAMSPMENGRLEDLRGFRYEMFDHVDDFLPMYDSWKLWYELKILLSNKAILLNGTLFDRPQLFTVTSYGRVIWIWLIFIPDYTFKSKTWGSAELRLWNNILN